MDVVCRPDIPCFCRPLTTPKLLAEHVLLGVVQLIKALLLCVWLNCRQGSEIAISQSLRAMPRATGAGTGDAEPWRASLSVVPGRIRSIAAAALGSYSGSSGGRGGGGGASANGHGHGMVGVTRRARFVLPVYHRFLTIEAWQCLIWGLFYLCQSYYDLSADGRALATVVFQVVRYVSSFAMAVSGEGVFLFLCHRSASSRTLQSCVTVASVWACLLTAASALLFLWWAGCTPLPTDGYAQMLWIAGWFPYWLRLAAMPWLYAAAGLWLLATRPKLAWERGALLLAAFNVVSSSTFVLTRVYFGVLSPDEVQLQDAIATPLIWVVYVPFLILVLERDSAYWSRAGFMACIVEEGGREIRELKSARKEACQRTPLPSV
eukprot:CAMPEP_0206052180 /NCGR_PEP_ID=MMETSP1466-20131121/33171_1 /ASSEMBLY_ACC=CAM_ASM_001126 /TAXON_ID=44452 /ORGANISM="Pavlova gyrans, Strain CCMP608" /LENGTH=376 /DNA_ID=CAMNT_0053427327 /DNA_START=31 /DNA_END=1157 /DNA_ORIENTATION=-